MKPGKTVATGSQEKSQTVEEIDLTSQEQTVAQIDSEDNKTDVVAAIKPSNNAQTRAVSYLRQSKRGIALKPNPSGKI